MHDPKAVGGGRGTEVVTLHQRDPQATEGRVRDAGTVDPAAHYDDIVGRRCQPSQVALHVVVPIQTEASRGRGAPAEVASSLGVRLVRAPDTPDGAATGGAR